MWSPLNIIALIVLVFVLIQKLCNQLVLTLVMMVVITFTMWSPLNIIDCLGFCGDPKALVLTLVMMVVSLMVIPHTTKMAKMPI